MQSIRNIFTRQVLRRASSYSQRSGLTKDKFSFSVRVLLNTTAAMSTDKSPGVLKGGENPQKLTDSEWKKRLPEERYHVLREHGTEQAFTGEYTFNKDSGSYHCGCCGVQLFSSDSKYESGCGWPSFYEALGREGSDESSTNVVRRQDTSVGMDRVEVLCKQCDAHLGHVFDDGPLPTKERFCINSVSLDFVAKKKQKDKGKL